jgi:hypothetical protein
MSNFLLKKFKCVVVILILITRYSLTYSHQVSPKTLQSTSIAKFLRGSAENPWVRYSLKKRGKGSKVFIEPLGEVVIFLVTVRNLWDVVAFDRANSRHLHSMVKIFWQRLPKTP